MLVLAEKGNYIEEILKAEGLNFSVSGALEKLENYDVVILPKTNVSKEQADILNKYVKNGGSLITFQPGNELSSLHGLRLLSDSISEGYIKIDTNSEMSKGLPGETLQYHGTATKYKTDRASVVAQLYATSNNATQHPAVAYRKYGKGQAIAFAYDLPLSIILTRQGNYRNAGIEKDGIKGLRAMDLFTDGWVDTSRNITNQADEQMRLLSRCIRYLAKKPLPSLWYFPDTLKTLVTLTNDGEYSDEKDIEPQFADIESKKCKHELIRFNCKQNI